MARLLYVHWNAEEAVHRAAPLRASGHAVTCHSEDGGDALRALRSRPPEVVVIDLARLPSQGRAVATFLRQQKATRTLPLVFVEGDPEKTARVRRDLPDAEFTDLGHVRGAVRRALRSAPKNPIVPDTMQGYSGTPLPKKLGVKAGVRVALVGAPRGFEATLGALPEGARTSRSTRSQAEVVVLFAKTEADLGSRWKGASAAVATGGRIWIAWPKQAAKTAKARPGDLTQAQVRGHGLDRGWVDFKICSIDETWSGLCFSKRKDSKR